MAEFDLAVVGGGINGAGIARDAAGRGLKVLLVEQNDLASGASSAPAMLLHGGLAEVQGRAVRRAHAILRERAILLRAAPHLVTPIRLVLPGPTSRPAWRVRAELFAYDHMARRSLRPTRTLDLTHHACGAPLRRRYTSGFEFSDATLDVARLAIVNAVDAATRGATIRTHARLLRAERSETWTLMLNCRGRRQVVTARAVVNAAGAGTGMVNETALRIERRLPVHLVKVSHIVVRKLFDHGRGYVLETPGGRLVHAVPFEDDFTLIGASEVSCVGDPGVPVSDRAEVDFLCEAINCHFRETITSHDIVRSFAAVACLPSRDAALDDAVVELDEENGRAPLLSVYGGKAADYRRTSEAAVDRLTPYFSGRPAWTSQTPLLGGELGTMDQLVAEICRRWRFLEPTHAARLTRAYGRRVEAILAQARSFDDLGARFGTDLSEAEVRYLMRHEFAETADDVLWRRSRLGMRTSRDDQERLARFMASECGAGTK
jgi:glycerol-3-phosphate dehydrogenase